MQFGKMQRAGSVRLAVVAAGVLAAPSLALASGGGVYPGDLGQAVAALVIFLLLLLVLGKYAWKPILKQLETRDDDIVAKYTEAEGRQAKADELAAEYQQQLASIDEEAAQVLADARRQAALQCDEVLQSARVEAKRMMDRAGEEVVTAGANAQRELQSQTAQMAAEIAERVLRRELTDADRRRLQDLAHDEIAQVARNESP